MTSIRQSNIELLRLLAMFLIVAGHAATHGHNIPQLALQTNSLFVIAMSQGARIAVDVFVIITGFFSAKNANLSKIGRLYRQIWFYSDVVALAIILITDKQFPSTVLIKSTFPVYTSQYWFATDYIILLLIAPLLNKVISTIDKRTHCRILFLSVVVFSLIPTIVPINPSFFNMLIWFIVLYLIGAYLRLYDLKIYYRIKYWHGIVALMLIMIAAVTIYYWEYGYNYFRHNSIYLLSEPNKLPAIICVLLLFVGFKNLNIGYTSWINSISISVFGVYLISDHPLIREYIFIPISENINSDLYPVIYLVWVLAIFTGCLIIESIRRNIDERIIITSSHNWLNLRWGKVSCRESVVCRLKFKSEYSGSGFNLNL